MLYPPLNDETTLKIHRLFQAGREQIFTAWTDSSALEQWFKPMGTTTVVRQLELRVGGEFYFDLHHPTGEQTYIVGRYIEIRRPEKLVFTWSSPSTQDHDTLVTLEFSEHSGVTEMILVHQRFTNISMTEGHLAGWSSCLDLIAEYTAG
jgi:uncharacterized protein YndB with AHSA1/START domain